MITKEMAVSLGHGQTLYHKTLRNKDGSAVRARVNGKCRVWVRRPDDFILPMKYGMRDCFYLEPHNAHEWDTVDPTEAARYEADKARSKAKLCRRFGLADDVPDCVVRDRMMDENVSEAEWPMWILKA